jgi:Helix-turn-helix domain
MSKSYEQLVRENIDAIREWRAEGYSARQIGERLGVKPKTLYLYMRTIPELADAWEAGNTALVQDILEPALLKQAVNGLPYVQVVKELRTVILPDGTTRDELVTVKEVHSVKYHPALLKWALQCLDRKGKWGDVEVKDELKTALDESISQYGV